MDHLVPSGSRGLVGLQYKPPGCAEQGRGWRVEEEILLVEGQVAVPAFWRLAHRLTGESGRPPHSATARRGRGAGGRPPTRPEPKSRVKTCAQVRTPNPILFMLDSLVCGMITESLG